MEKNRVAAQMSKIGNTVSILDNQILAIETSEWNKCIVQALRESTSALKGLNKEVSTTEIDDIVRNLEDQLENASEVTKLLSSDMPGLNNTMTGADGYEMSIEDELDSLLDDGVDETMACKKVPPLKLDALKGGATTNKNAEEKPVAIPSYTLGELLQEVSSVRSGIVAPMDHQNSDETSMVREMQLAS